MEKLSFKNKQKPFLLEGYLKDAQKYQQPENSIDSLSLSLPCNRIVLSKLSNLGNKEIPLRA